MVPQNLITALPIWDAKEKQTFRLAGNTDGSIECRYDRMLPWTILRSPAATPTYVYLVKKDGLTALSITALLSMSSSTEDGNGYAYFEASVDINQASAQTDYRWISGAWSANTTKTWAQFVEAGAEYYLEFSFSGTKFYSELMRINDFPESADLSESCIGSRVKIEGTPLCAVGDLPASLNVNKLYIDANTSDPQYIIEREVAKDGQEEETAVWVKMKKRYNITFHAIETVVDWLHSLVLYGGNVSVTDQYGFQSTIADIEIETSWPEEFNGWLAEVKFSYTVTYLSGTGCC